MIELPDDRLLSRALRGILKKAGITRPALFANDATRKGLTWYDLRATGIPGGYALSLVRALVSSLRSRASAPSTSFKVSPARRGRRGGAAHADHPGALPG